MDENQTHALDELPNAIVSANTLGWLCITAYCLLTAFAAVWVSESFTRIDGATLTFTTLLVAQLFFLSCAFLKKENILLFVLDNKSLIVKSNVLTLFSWYFMFLALQKVEASVESALYQGIIPMTVLVCSARAQGITLKRALGPALTLLFLALLAESRFSLAGMESSHTSTIIQGIALALIAGATAGLYVHVTGAAHRQWGATLLQVLTTRFVLLLVVTGFLGHEQFALVVSNENGLAWKLMFLALSIVVLPVLFLQTSIKNLGASRVSVMTPLVPALALAAEFVINPWGHITTPILVLMVCLSVIISNVWLNHSDRPGPVETQLREEGSSR
ncbi:EamA family transporter [Marinobacter sp. JSM 1782161]|uniref:EamA family transporter n=1 Tax=Marinobacter sp. JSM 1782161 TaxID=2685906 RepID=UPI001402C387|nr:EamA family transporter [Marinobacter sp. JSM 1782161]